MKMFKKTAKACRVFFNRLVMPELSFWHDWDSFAFWKPRNWRDFTVINISGETGPNRWYEIHIALLGFHFWSQWLRQLKLEDEA